MSATTFYPPIGETSGTAAEPEAKPKRRSRLRIAGVLMFPVFMAFGLITWAWDSTHHDHEGAHGNPAPAAALAASMSDGPFTADDGTLVGVQNASCAGQGEAVSGGYTHFTCQLAFDDGRTDEVLVHLLPGDELVFKSTLETTGP
jgi:hypothetical protein